MKVKKEVIKMSKINIKVILKNNENEIINNYKAIKNDNKIIYTEKEFKVTLYLEEIVKLKRENDECQMMFEFIPNKKTKIKIFLDNKLMELDILTDYVVKLENLIKIKYKVIETNEDVLYELEVYDE